MAKRGQGASDIPEEARRNLRKRAVMPGGATKNLALGGHGRRPASREGLDESAADIGGRVNTNEQLGRTARSSKAKLRPGLARSGQVRASSPSQALGKTAKGLEPHSRVPRGTVSRGKKTEEADIAPPAPKVGRRSPAKQPRLKVERAEKSAGPTGRARNRMDAEPRGKKGTSSTVARRGTGGRVPRQSGVEGKRKPVRGSPSAKRRLENRAAAVKTRPR